MLITCPNCLAQFNIDERQIQGTQQTFLCSVCHHQWQQKMSLPAETSLPVSESDEQSFVFEAPQKPKMRRHSPVPQVFQPVAVESSGHKHTWFIVCIGLCCFIGAIVIAKIYQPRSVPQVQNTATKPQFVIQNVKAYTDNGPNGSAKMRIYGDILNPHDTAGAVPYLVADLKDVQGHIVQSVLLPQKGIWLEGHEKYLFFEEITLPRAEALKVYIHF